MTSKSYFLLRNFISDLGALDLDYSGSTFTWCNRRGGIANIRERFDPIIASPEWHLLFPQAGVVHLHPSELDHLPIQLSLQQDHPFTLRPFRFFEAWTRDPSWDRIIRDAWNYTSRSHRRVSICSRLSNTFKSLKTWNRENFRFCQTRIWTSRNSLPKLTKVTLRRKI